MTHKEGKWAKYAHKFAKLDGEAMSRLSKEDFLRRVPDNGDAIYNDWRAVVKASGAGHAVRDAARPKHPVEWSRDETQEWLKTHDEDIFAEYAHKFAELDGKRMSRLSEEDFLRFADSPVGSAIYNDWRAELLVVPRVVWSPGTFEPPPPTDGTYMPDKFKYVDKTESLHGLLTHAEQFLFVTAPRRMGKSTMLSMLKHMALGHWEAFPPGTRRWTDDASDVAVIHLNWTDMSGLKECKPDDLEAKGMAWFAAHARLQHRIVCDDKKIHPIRQWITQLHKRGKRRVVILIDECAKVVLDVAVSRGFGEAANFVDKVSRPFFESTKDVPGLIKVVAVGVTSVSLTTMASGANHFRDAVRLEPDLARAIGFTPEQLGRTYGRLLLAQCQRLPDGHALETVDEAVQYVKTRGNGWCIERTASADLLSPYVVNSFLRAETDDFLRTDLKQSWAASGPPRALVALLRSKAPQLLETRRVQLRDLYAEPTVEAFFSDKNADQLAFQLGYLSIKVGSLEYDADGKASVELRPPNEGVEDSVMKDIVASSQMNNQVAVWIKDAVVSLDWVALEAAIKDLSEEFMRVMGRPFANEAELHSWGATWVAAVAVESWREIYRVSGATALYVSQELRLWMDGDSPDLRSQPRCDSVIFWSPAGAAPNDDDDSRRGVVIEWGFKAVEEAALTKFLEEKVEQVERRRYLERVETFQRRRGQPFHRISGVAVVISVRQDKASGEWVHLVKAKAAGGDQRVEDKADRV